MLAGLLMVVAGGVCFLVGIAYYFFTTDLPDGNFKELRESGEIVKTETGKGSFLLAARDYRVWALFFVYAACFGIELTINNTWEMSEVPAHTGLKLMFYQKFRSKIASEELEELLIL